MGKAIMGIRQALDSYRGAEPRSEMNHDGVAAVQSLRVRVTLARGVETLIEAEGPLTVHLAVEDGGTALMVCLEHPGRRPRAGLSADQGETTLQPSSRLNVWG
jgi:hypothetical protein